MCQTCCKHCKCVMKARQLFILPEAPRPGLNGINCNQLTNVKFCLTGIYNIFTDVNYVSQCPKISQCQCLDIGKEEVRAMIKLFGGITVQKMSGITDFLVIGEAPSFAKLNTVRSFSRMQTITIQVL